MTKRKATLEEANKFILDMLTNYQGCCLSRIQAEFILDSIFPFSWQNYCDKRNIQTVLSDD